MRLFRGLTLALLVFAALPAAAGAAVPSTSRQSVSATGAQIAPGTCAGGSSCGGLNGRVSANGRWVVFESPTDFLPNDTNARADVFLRDTQTGAVSIVSRKPDGKSTNGASFSPSISSDGRLIAFITNATDLGSGTTNTATDVYLFDRVAGSMRRVTTVAGSDAVGASTAPKLSRDGTHLVFVTESTQFASGDTSATNDVYLADTATLTLRLMSARPGGTTGGSAKSNASVSNNGRFVTFHSTDPMLVANVTENNGAVRDVYVRDVQAGVTTRASVSPNGGEADNSSYAEDISADGCLILFQSFSENLVAGTPDGDPSYQYVRNRCQPNTEVVSLGNDGIKYADTGGSVPASISEDGCQVAFLSQSAILGAPADKTNAFVRDRCAGVTSRVSVGQGGEADQVRSRGVFISGGTGRYIAFDSEAALVPSDTNAATDVYLRDTATTAAPLANLQVAVTGRSVTADGSASSDPDGSIAGATISYGDGTPATAGLTGSHDYTADGTFTVTLTVTDSDGLSATVSKPVTVTATGTGQGGGGGTGGGGTGGGGGGTGGGGTGGGGGNPATLRVTGGVLSRARFKAVKPGTSFGRGRGATLLLAVNAPARLTLNFQRLVPGRRAKGTCSTRARRGRPCTKRVSAGSTSVALKSGDNTIRLTGRMGRRSFAPGKYRLAAVARAADGRKSRALVRNFTITPG